MLLNNSHTSVPLVKISDVIRSELIKILTHEDGKPLKVSTESLCDSLKGELRPRKKNDKAIQESRRMSGARGEGLKIHTQSCFY